ncbi:conserved hypothetical protein, partial [Ricinus communis]
ADRHCHRRHGQRLPLRQHPSRQRAHRRNWRAHQAAHRQRGPHHQRQRIWLLAGVQERLCVQHFWRHRHQHLQSDRRRCAARHLLHRRRVEQPWADRQDHPVQLCAGRH